MAYTFSSNMPNALGSSDLLEAFMDGLINSETDLSWVSLIPTDQNNIKNVGILPPSQYAQVTEGADIPTKAIEEGFAATYTHTNLGIGFAVSLQTKLTMPREMLVSFLSQLGASAARRLSSDCYGLLNNGTTTNGADGVPTFSASHPSNVGVQSNLATTALDFASYETAQRSLMTQQTPDGLLAGYRATVLIVPPALNVTAHKVNTAIYQSQDYEPNMSAGAGIRTIVAPDLTNSTSRWFLLDERFSSFKCYILRGPSPKLIEEDEDSHRMEVRDRMIYAVGQDGWRGTFSS